MLLVLEILGAALLFALVLTAISKSSNKSHDHTHEAPEEEEEEEEVDPKTTIYVWYEGEPQATVYEDVTDVNSDAELCELQIEQDTDDERMTTYINTRNPRFLGYVISTK